MTLTVSGTIYLIFSLLTFYMAGAYRSRPLMGAAVAALLLFAVLLIQVCVVRFRTHVEVPERVSATEAEQVVLSVSAVNRTPFASERAVFYVRTGYERFPKSFRKEKVFFHLNPGEKTVRFALTPVYAGPAEVRMDSLQLSDLFGFFRIRKKIRGIIHLSVLPEEGISAADEETEQRREHIREEQSSYRKGDDENEIYQIREYRPGDTLRRVHWNLSARMEQLLIREPGDTSETAAEFFLQKTEPGFFSTERETDQYLKKRGEFYRAVSNEVRDALLQTDLVRVYLSGDGSREVVEVRQPEEVSGLMEAVYEAGVTEFAGDLSENEETE